jgi:hypothetical protein
VATATASHDRALPEPGPGNSNPMVFYSFRGSQATPACTFSRAEASRLTRDAEVTQVSS